ncbi:MAG TPA: ATP-binding cassette domain-containing protein [Thermoanaerobaculia bacterium]
MSDPLVQVRDLVKVFRVTRKEPGLKGALKGLFRSETSQLRAVDGVSFSLERGEMVGYIGPNGAGKSTTIKMLTGILTPTSGEIVVNGMVPWRDRRVYTKRIGVVFGQRTQLWWDIAVVESFGLLREIYGVSESDYAARMKEFDDLLEIGRFLHQPVRKLSLGERMRCDLAASLLHSPPLLFLDEPTIGLDVVAKSNVRAFLSEVNRRDGTTVILTTHDLDDIEELCRRVVIIDRGQVLYDGVLQGLRDRHLPEARIRFDLRDAAGTGEASLDVAGRRAERVGKNRYQIVVDKRTATAADVIREIVNRYPVVDLSVSEPDIEEVVTRIYRESARRRPDTGGVDLDRPPERRSAIRRG